MGPPAVASRQLTGGNQDRATPAWYGWPVPSPRLLAVSDLHVRHPDNRALADGLRPVSDGDWLLVAGDVAEQVDDVLGTLERLRARFARVVWVPGNHELWTRSKDPVPLRGVAR